MDVADGDMIDFLRSEGAAPEHKARIWIKQIGEALSYMHDRGIVHRDIKSENVLLCKGVAKLTDFGFARRCRDKKTNSLKMSETFCGSDPYVAPEIIKAQKYNPMLADAWSMGVLLFVITNNAFPFDDSDLTRMADDQMAKRWKFSLQASEKLSENLKDLIHHLLEPDLEKRYTIKQLLNHSWFA